MSPAWATMLRRAAVVCGAALLALALSACGPLNAMVGIRDAPASTTGGALTSTRATEISTELLARASVAARTPGDAGVSQRSAVYAGAALAAANAAAKLAPTETAAERSAAQMSPEAPVVLAVSRGRGYPRSMVVQTTLAQSKLPVLHLLVTTDVRTPYKIAASATMLSGAQVRAFDPLAAGSPALGDGAGLVAAPSDLAARYAASLNFPTPADRPSELDSDSFGDAIRATAKRNSDSMRAVATLTQVHTLREVSGGLRTQGDSGAIVFAALDRKDTLVNRGGAAITASARFTALSGLTSVSAEATTSTLELVVFWVPGSGAGTVVAATEQLYAAKGK